MRAVEGMIPPGGWHFIQDGVTIKASGYRGKDGILQAILEYRISNDKDIGDVENEFLEWFCKEYPRNCQFHQVLKRMKEDTTPWDSKVKVAPRPVSKSDLINRVIIELSKKVKPQDVVLEQEANARALVCLNCSENQPRPKTCGGCQANVERTTALIRNNRDHQLHAKLQICAKTNLDTRTGIWVRKDLLPKSDSAPSNCWNK